MSDDKISLGEALSNMESLCGTFNDYDNACLRKLLDQSATANARIAELEARCPVSCHKRESKL